MARRWHSRLAAVALLVLLTGCTADPATPPAATASATSPDNVIDFLGLPNITIGATMADLTAAGTVTTTNPSCGPVFTTIQTASPVFDSDKLVLIWAHPPLHTPENIMVGTPVEDVRHTYPTAVDLTRPAGSTQYQGLLVVGPDGLAYLILHDNEQVQKLVVGMEKYARMLFDTGFGSC